MTVVFVHGVATRAGPSYDRDLLSRNAMIKSFLNLSLGLAPTQDPVNAYWGDHGATFRWNHSSDPQPGIESLGSIGNAEDELLSEALEGAESDPESPLVNVAAKSLERAIDLLWAVTAIDIRTSEEALALAELGRSVSLNMYELGVDAELADVRSDSQWLQVLVLKLIELGPTHDGNTGVESLGGEAIWSRLHESVLRIRSSAARLSGGAAAAVLRTKVSHEAGLFFGDAFNYVDKRGEFDAPGPIVQAVVADFEAAIALGEPLDVIAHSLGGLVVYDILSYFRPELQVRNLITVGSQVGFFEELRLTRKFWDDEDVPGRSKVPKLSNVERWINVYDECDLLSFSTQSIFEGVQDYRYSSGSGLFQAHSTYFLRPSFYRRLAERVRDLQ